MSNAEFFNPSEGGESYDPAAFERFKDQMKKSAAFMAAARKGEQKQKQKEDRLAKILLRFIQTNQKSDIVMLAARLLEENIPASVILAIIILGNEELKEEVKQNVPLLEAQETEPSAEKPVHKFSLMNRFSDSSLPLKIKAEIDEWGKGIFEAASASPFRVLETALDADGNVKKIVIACAANVLSSFMESQQTELKADYEAFLSFCELLVQAIMKKIKEQVSNQKELQGEP